MDGVVTILVGYTVLTEAKRSLRFGMFFLDGKHEPATLDEAFCSVIKVSAWD